MKKVKTLPENGKYVLMFVSNHCPYCRQMEKTITQIERKYMKLGIEFFSINISANPGIAEKYGIRSTPQTFFMNNKKVVGQEIGAVSVKTIEMQLSDLLKDGELLKAFKNLFKRKKS